MHTFFIDKRTYLVSLFIVSFFIFPLLSFAEPASQTNGLPPSQTNGLPPSQTYGPSGQVMLQNTLNNITGFCGFIKQLFLSAGALGVPIAVLFLVYAGFLFVRSEERRVGKEGR